MVLVVRSGVFHLRFVVDKVAQGQGFLLVLCLSFVSTIPPLLRAHLRRNTASIRTDVFSQEEATCLAALCFTLLLFLKNSKYYYEINMLSLCFSFQYLDGGPHFREENVTPYFSIFYKENM
jgi:hypothetical protein